MNKEQQSAGAAVPSALEWTKDGDKSCGYNNWLAVTPFGRILITWKGWKEPWGQTATIDEFPGELPSQTGDPDWVRDFAEAEYHRRLLAAIPPASPQAGEVEREDLRARHLDLLSDVLDAKEVMRAAGIPQDDFPTMFKAFAAKHSAPATPAQMDAASGAGERLTPQRVAEIWADISAQKGGAA